MVKPNTHRRHDATRHRFCSVRVFVCCLRSLNPFTIYSSAVLQTLLFNNFSEKSSIKITDNDAEILHPLKKLSFTYFKVTFVGISPYYAGYRTLRPQDTSASRHSGTLRHRSQDTSTPKTWYETLPHECRDRGKAGTLRPRTIPMRHSSTGDSS